MNHTVLIMIFYVVTCTSSPVTGGVATSSTSPDSNSPSCHVMSGWVNASPQSLFCLRWWNGRGELLLLHTTPSSCAVHSVGSFDSMLCAPFTFCGEQPILSFGASFLLSASFSWIARLTQNTSAKSPASLDPQTLKEVFDYFIAETSHGIPNVQVT